MEIELEVEDGLLTALDFGGHGPGVLLVHGTGHNAAVWSDVAARLVDRCHLVAVDLRGHGQNLCDSSDSEQYWRDLAPALEALSWDRPVLVGHSTGGYAVTALTASRLATPAELCVVDGVVLDDRPTTLAQHAGLRTDDALAQLRDGFRYGWHATDTELRAYVERSVAESGTDWLNASARPELVESVTRRSFVRRDSSWLRRPTIEEILAVTALDPTAEVFPGVDVYERIECPMTIVLPTGGFYATRQAEVEALVDAAAGRRLEIVESNHNVPMTHPAELAAIIGDLASATPGSDPRPARRA